MHNNQGFAMESNNFLTKYLYISKYTYILFIQYQLTLNRTFPDIKTSIMLHVINPYVVCKVLSRNLLILSVALCMCLMVCIIYQEATTPFIYSLLLAVFSGICCFLFSKKDIERRSLTRKDAYLTVTLSWLILSVIGSLPYLFSRSIPSVVDAVFESVSGFTTTGSSILSDIESMPKSILFWRSLTHWIGGIGIIVLVIVVMPSLQIGGYHLFSMESSFQEKIRPRIRTIGKQLLYIYLLLTGTETLLLLAGGMPMFESVCHAFGTVATGGFSPRNDSIAGYSPFIQYIIMVFMLLSGTNFVIHYYLLRREFKKIQQNEELRLYLTVIFVLGLTFSSILYFKVHQPAEVAVREAFFQTISIVTCTGYATADYLMWPEYAWVLLFFVMFLGGSTGSTAGGIKMVRHLVLLKNFTRLFRLLCSPFAILPVKVNGKALHESENTSILTFIVLYCIVFAFGSAALILAGLDFKSAAGAAATAMAGIGPGIGTVGPASNFAHLPDAAKIILSLLMLVGRLEIYTVLVLFTRGFWRS